MCGMKDFYRRVADVGCDQPCRVEKENRVSEERKAQMFETVSMRRCSRD